MSIKSLIRELDLLHLPFGQYAITNSATLAIRGLREANDLDIIVTETLWQQLRQLHNGSTILGYESVIIGNLEILGKYLRAQEQIYATADQLIKSSEMIGRHPFVKLEIVRDYKQTFARQKDLIDITLIDRY